MSVKVVKRRNLGLSVKKALMKNGLSETRRNFFEALLTPESPTYGNMGASYALSHPNANAQTCRREGSKIFGEYRDIINKKLKESVLSDEWLDLKLGQLLQAKEKRFFAHEGLVVSEVEVDALETQRKAWDMAAKVKGKYAAQRIEVDTFEDRLRRLDEEDRERNKPIK